MWTTNAIRAAANLDASGNERLSTTNRALFLICRMADSIWGAWEPCPRMFNWKVETFITRIKNPSFLCSRKDLYCTSERVFDKEILHGLSESRSQYTVKSLSQNIWFFKCLLLLFLNISCLLYALCISLPLLSSSPSLSLHLSLRCLFQITACLFLFLRQHREFHRI